MEGLIQDKADDRAKAAFLSNDGSFAGAWLFSIPKDNYNTMTTSEFITAMKLRLDIEMLTLPDKSLC